MRNKKGTYVSGGSAGARSCCLLCLLACLVTLCACSGKTPQAAEEMPPAAQQTEAELPLVDTSSRMEVPFVHYEKQLGGYTVVFTLPAHWLEICEVETLEREVAVRHKPSAEFGGWLFSLVLMEGEDWRDFPETAAVAADGEYTLVCMRPSDVQFDVTVAEEYLTLSREIDSILTQVEFYKS